MANHRHIRIALICSTVSVGMLALTFASVPLYRIFCQVTGYGGTIQRVNTASEIILDDEILVRFDANVSGGLNWEFEPLVRSMKLKIGEQREAYYRVRNLSSTTSHGTASFNVSPAHAGTHFNKLECFCYTEQALSPGESQDMPVTFFVDPDIIHDPLFQGSRTITLSYTFFPDASASEPAPEVSDIKTDLQPSQFSLYETIDYTIDSISEAKNL